MVLRHDGLVARRGSDVYLLKKVCFLLRLSELFPLTAHAFPSSSWAGAVEYDVLLLKASAPKEPSPTGVDRNHVRISQTPSNLRLTVVASTCDRGS
jgi:hypothetical protein